MKRATVLTLAVLAGLTASTGMGVAQAASQTPGDPCAVPESVYTIDGALPRAWERLKRGGALPILVLNSASARSDTAYPALLEKELAARLPDRKVSVTVRNAPGATAQEMLPILNRELAASSASLLVWQVGRRACTCPRARCGSFPRTRAMRSRAVAPTRSPGRSNACTSTCCSAAAKNPPAS